MNLQIKEEHERVPLIFLSPEGKKFFSLHILKSTNKMSCYSIQKRRFLFLRLFIPVEVGDGDFRGFEWLLIEMDAYRQWNAS